jgi:hypothetical protein
MANPSQASVSSRVARLWNHRAELAPADYAAESRKIDEASLYLIAREPGENIGPWRKRRTILEHLEHAVADGKLVGRPRVLDDPNYAASILDTDAQLTLLER